MPTEQEKMDTIVYRQGDHERLAVAPTVLKTIQALVSDRNDGTFTCAEVVDAISAQGWMMVPLTVTSALERLYREGHSLRHVQDDRWVYNADVRVGKIGRILAVQIDCPLCGGACKSARGSSMIMEDDREVTCEDCGARVQVPLNTFRR